MDKISDACVILFTQFIYIQMKDNTDNQLQLMSNLLFSVTDLGVHR